MVEVFVETGRAERPSFFSHEAMTARGRVRTWRALIYWRRTFEKTASNDDGDERRAIAK